METESVSSSSQASLVEEAVDVKEIMHNQPDLTCTKSVSVNHGNSTTQLAPSKPGGSEEPLKRTGFKEEGERPMNLVKKMKVDTDIECLTPADDSKVSSNEDAPMDLSSGTKRKETTYSRKSAIERLRDELCNEETTLLLLKKLQRSQMVHRSQDGSMKTGDSTVFKSPVQSAQNSRPPAPVPPPLVRGGAQPSPNPPSNAMVQSRPEPPRVASYGQQSSNMQHANMHSAMRVSSQIGSAPRPAPARPVAAPETPPASRPQVNVPTPEQTLAQSKDAAKLALRRQLEATLLQIPPPKPAALAVNFIPSIGSNVEFISLVGLEEVVSCIATPETKVEGEGIVATLTESEPRKPFQCAHCQTDFTPVWRRSQSGGDEILCERCAITAQKRMLKQEHTARLKAAFMHALQQEREIEASNVLPASSSLGSVRPAAIANDPKGYPGLSQQYSRSVPSFHSMTDPRMLHVSSPYGLVGNSSRPQLGMYTHRSDHQLVKRMN